MSFYELLGIPASGTTLDIKTAYKQLARKYHPDVSPPGRVDEYTERFIMVQEAYETLSDPKTRALYDTDMSKGLHRAFSARRRNRTDDVDDQMEGKGEWKSKWTSQLSDLKKRSKFKENNSWAAQMRKQRSDSA
jgi:DnaJ-class molecular chaperone